MRKYRLELLLLFITIITLLLWYFKINVYIRFLFYGCLVGYFLIKKQFSLCILVTLFSVFSHNEKQSIFLIDYTLIVILFLFVLIKGIKIRKIYIGNLLIPILIYTLYNIISLIWTPSLIIGLEGIVAILEGYLIYFIATNTLPKPDFNIISKIASFLMIVISTLLIIKYSQIGSNVITNKQLIHLGFANPNIVASLYPLLLPLALYKYFDKNRAHWFYFIIDIFNLIGLFLTLSKGAYIGIIVILGLFIFKFGPQFFRKSRKLLLLPFFLIVTLIILLLFYLQKFYGNNNRLAIYQLGWNNFISNPILGRGVKSSEYLIKNSLQLPYNHYHNFLLQITSCLGLVGLILFLMIVFKWIKIFKGSNNRFIILCTFSIIGSLVHQLVDVSFDLYFFGVYFYLILGIVEVYRHYDLKDNLFMKQYPKKQ